MGDQNEWEVRIPVWHGYSPGPHKLRILRLLSSTRTSTVTATVRLDFRASLFQYTRLSRLHPVSEVSSSGLLSTGRVISLKFN